MRETSDERFTFMVDNELATAEEVVETLSLLLTDGRLGDTNRDVLVDGFKTSHAAQVSEKLYGGVLLKITTTPGCNLYTQCGNPSSVHLARWSFRIQSTMLSSGTTFKLTNGGMIVKGDNNNTFNMKIALAFLAVAVAFAGKIIHSKVQFDH